MRSEQTNSRVSSVQAKDVGRATMADMQSR